MNRTARIASQMALAVLIAVCLVSSTVSTTPATTPYGSSLSAPLPGSEARPFPPGCAAAICDANGKCEKHPGATTKCKSGGGTCTLQSC